MIQLRDSRSRTVSVQDYTAYLQHVTPFNQSVLFYEMEKTTYLRCVFEAGVIGNHSLTVFVSDSLERRYTVYDQILEILDSYSAQLTVFGSGSLMVNPLSNLEEYEGMVARWMITQALFI